MGVSSVVPPSVSSVVGVFSAVFSTIPVSRGKTGKLRSNGDGVRSESDEYADMAERMDRERVVNDVVER